MEIVTTFSCWKITFMLWMLIWRSWQGIFILDMMIHSDRVWMKFQCQVYWGHNDKIICCQRSILCVVAIQTINDAEIRNLVPVISRLWRSYKGIFALSFTDWFIKWGQSRVNLVEITVNTVNVRRARMSKYIVTVSGYGVTGLMCCPSKTEVLHFFSRPNVLP